MNCVFMKDTTTVNRCDMGHRWHWGDLQQAGPTGVHKTLGQRATPLAHMTSQGTKHSGMCPGYQAHSQKCPAGSEWEWVTGKKRGIGQINVGRIWVFDMTCRNEYEENGETKVNSFGQKRIISKMHECWTSILLFYVYINFFSTTLYANGIK